MSRDAAARRRSALACRRSRGAAMVCALALAAGCGGEEVARRAGANVLLITLDTTRADHLGCYGSRTVATPHLDALAADGVRFDNAVTSVPLTLPAHASLMTGSYPMRHGVRDNGGFLLGREQTTLAEVLAEAGFRTSAAVGAFVLHRVWGIAQGFADYDDRFDSAGREGADGGDPLALHVERDGAEVVRSAIGWWDAHPDERFFVWLHFYDPHLPYRPPPEHAARYGPGSYAGEVAYTDALVGRVLDHLRASGRYESTLIVVLGDHGEGLGEHDEPDHGIFLYDSTLRIPLLVRAPGGPRGRVADVLARDIDVMPTILDYVGVPAPATVEGRSLLPALAGRAGDDTLAYAESYYARYHYGWSALRALRDARYKYIEAPTPELYDLTADPREANNVVALYPDVAEALARRLVERAGEAGAAPRPAATDPDAAARLRALGYVGASVTRADGDLPDPKDRVANLGLLSTFALELSEDLAQGRFQDVVTKTERMAALEPDFLDAYQLQAEAYRRLGRTADAIATLRRALALHPDSLYVLQDLVVCHIAAGDHRVARDLLERIRALSPEYTTARLVAAEAFRTAGRADLALEQLGAALEADPELALAWYRIGEIRLRQDDLPAARDAIRKALALRADLRDAHYNLALIAERAGDREAARREYEAELARFPDHFEAWVNLGLLWDEAGEAARAAAAFRGAIDARPGHHLGYYLLARTHAAAGRVDDEVLELAAKAARLDPSFDEAGELLRRIRRAREES